MARTPEGKVKDKVVAELASMGAYYFFPVMTGFGNSGIPDIVGCINGRFFAIECKSGNNKPTRLQISQMEEIVRCGGVALVINEDNIGEVRQTLEAV